MNLCMDGIWPAHPDGGQSGAGPAGRGGAVGGWPAPPPMRG